MFGKNKQFKPKSFGYKPQFYDPTKDNVEYRLKEVRRVHNAEDGDYVAGDISFRIREGLRTSRNISNRKTILTADKIRLLIFMIIGAIMVFGYFFLQAYLPQLQEQEPTVIESLELD